MNNRNHYYLKYSNKITLLILLFIPVLLFSREERIDKNKASKIWNHFQSFLRNKECDKAHQLVYFPFEDKITFQEQDPYIKSFAGEADSIKVLNFEPQESFIEIQSLIYTKDKKIHRNFYIIGTGIDLAMRLYDILLCQKPEPEPLKHVIKKFKDLNASKAEMKFGIQVPPQYFTWKYHDLLNNNDITVKAGSKEFAKMEQGKDGSFYIAHGKALMDGDKFYGDPKYPYCTIYEVWDATPGHNNDHWIEYRNLEGQCVVKIKGDLIVVVEEFLKGTNIAKKSMTIDINTVNEKGNRVMAVTNRELECDIDGMPKLDDKGRLKCTVINELGKRDPFFIYTEYLDHKGRPVEVVKYEGTRYEIRTFNSDFLPGDENIARKSISVYNDRGYYYAILSDLQPNGKFVDENPVYYRDSSGNLKYEVKTGLVWDETKGRIKYEKEYGLKKWEHINEKG